MKHAYVEKLEALFRANANAEKAGPMEAYMRNLFPFLGLKNPERVALQRQFFAEHGLPGLDELYQVVRELWQLPEREFHYAALGILEKFVKKVDASHIDFLEELLVTKSWWDSVDTLNGRLIGPHFTRFPEQIPAYTERWIESDNFWLQRSAIIFQLSYKKRTDVERMYKYIRRRAGESEFFVRKAIGWALREYSKTDEAAVRRFVAETEMSPLSKREALKYVDKHA